MTIFKVGVGVEVWGGEGGGDIPFTICTNDFESTKSNQATSTSLVIINQREKEEHLYASKPTSGKQLPLMK